MLHPDIQKFTLSSSVRNEADVMNVKKLRIEPQLTFLLYISGSLGTNLKRPNPLQTQYDPPSAAILVFTQSSTREEFTVKAAGIDCLNFGAPVEDCFEDEESFEVFSIRCYSVNFSLVRP